MDIKVSTHIKQILILQEYVKRIIMDKLIRLPKVMEHVQFSNSSIWELIKKNKFPQPIKISHKVTVWRESDIENFIDDPVGYGKHLAEHEKSENTIIKTA